MLDRILCCLIWFAALALAQFPPPPTNQTIIKVAGGNITVRYKETHFVNDTKSFAGYVDLSEKSHMFFWFYEAEEDPAQAPLTMWQNGGPGSTSMYGLFTEIGPFSIQPNGTIQKNPYAWNQRSNMLFVDQPESTGFSYTTLVNGTINGTTNEISITNSSLATGTFSNPNDPVTGDSYTAADTMWRFMQAWLEAFPQYQSTDLNLFSESYGGHYTPANAWYFMEQNKRIANGTISGINLPLKTVGIGNGAIEKRIQQAYFVAFSVNNTYEIIAYNETVFTHGMQSYFGLNGCLEQMLHCQNPSAEDKNVTAICAAADLFCSENVEYLYYDFSGRSSLDIRHAESDPIPDVTSFKNFLNQESVQIAIGVPINFTAASAVVDHAFKASADAPRGTFKQNLEYILDNGVQLVLYFGDADYVCNWMGGEAVSLAMNYNDQDNFRQALYDNFTVNGTSYGQVRQAGNFSFVRVYEAGHLMPYYQPEAALSLFNRAIFKQDLASGTSPTNDSTGLNVPGGTYGSVPISGMNPGPFLQLNGTKVVTATPPVFTIPSLNIQTGGSGPQFNL